LSYDDRGKSHFDNTDNLPEDLKNKVLRLRSLTSVSHELSKYPGGSLKQNIEAELALLLESQTTSAMHVQTLTLENKALQDRITVLERDYSELSSDHAIIGGKPLAEKHLNSGCSTRAWIISCVVVVILWLLYSHFSSSILREPAIPTGDSTSPRSGNTP